MSNESSLKGQKIVTEGFDFRKEKKKNIGMCKKRGEIIDALLLMSFLHHIWWLKQNILTLTTVLLNLYKGNT